MTKEEVTKAFKAELVALLTKYSTPDTKASIVAEDHYQGYPECGSDVRMTVNIPAKYDVQGNCIREWTEIDLGGDFDQNDI